MLLAVFTPNGIRVFKALTHKQGCHSTVKVSQQPWLGIRDGNITFQDSLDFDLSEIDSVYEDNLENQ